MFHLKSPQLAVIIIRYNKWWHSFPYSFYLPDRTVQQSGEYNWYPSQYLVLCKARVHSIRPRQSFLTLFGLFWRSSGRKMPPNGSDYGECNELFPKLLWEIRLFSVLCVRVSSEENCTFTSPVNLLTSKASWNLTFLQFCVRKRGNH